MISIDGERNLDWPLDVAFQQIASLNGSGLWSVNLAASFESSLPTEALSVLPSGHNRRTTRHSDLIFDLGMHNGDDTDFYLKKGFRVVAVDANPVLCANASERFKSSVQSKQLTICNVGIAPARGMLSFYINQDISEWSSFDYAIASRGHDVCEIKVPTVTPYDLFDAFGIPHYCKIDIEGMDGIVCAAIYDLQLRPEYVSFENGALKDFDVLSAAGYSAFQLVEQSSIPRTTLPVVSSEGKAIDYVFKPGSSGPFGRDLQGVWLRVEEMRILLNEHHEKLKARPDRGFDWWDLHASNII